MSYLKILELLKKCKKIVVVGTRINGPHYLGDIDPSVVRRVWIDIAPRFEKWTATELQSLLDSLLEIGLEPTRKSDFAGQDELYQYGWLECDNVIGRERRTREIFPGEDDSLSPEVTKPKTIDLKEIVYITLHPSKETAALDARLKQPPPTRSNGARHVSL